MRSGQSKRIVRISQLAGAPGAKYLHDSACPIQSTPSHTKLLAQVCAQCQAQPSGGYRAGEVGQVLYKLGLTDKAARTQFLKSILGLREVGTGGDKRLIF